MTAKRMDIDLRNLRNLYDAGESVLALSKRFAISRRSIAIRLIEAGATIRGGSEANKIRMQRLSASERRCLAAKAHAAVRGSRQSDEHRNQIASTRQARQLGVGPAEISLRNRLMVRGERCTLQKAVGRYNLDVALNGSPVAVEIFGGCWHNTARHARRFRKRLDYIRDAGWTVIVIWVTKDYPLDTGAVEYVVSLAKRMRTSKPARGEEHVIRGDGKPSAIGGTYLDYRSDVGGDKCGPFVRGKDGRFSHEAIRV